MLISCCCIEPPCCTHRKLADVGTGSGSGSGTTATAPTVVWSKHVGSADDCSHSAALESCTYGTTTFLVARAWTALTGTKYQIQAWDGDGTKLWAVDWDDLSTGNRSVPDKIVTNGSKVWVGAGPGGGTGTNTVLACLEADDGSVTWSLLNVEIGSSIITALAPSIGNYVWAGYKNTQDDFSTYGRVTRFDSTGELINSFPTGYTSYNTDGDILYPSSSAPYSLVEIDDLIWVGTSSITARDDYDCETGADVDIGEALFAAHIWVYNPEGVIQKYCQSPTHLGIPGDGYPSHLVYSGGRLFAGYATLSDNAGDWCDVVEWDVTTCEPLRGWDFSFTEDTSTWPYGVRDLAAGSDFLVVVTNFCVKLNLSDYSAEYGLAGVRYVSVDSADSVIASIQTGLCATENTALTPEVDDTCSYEILVDFTGTALPQSCDRTIESGTGTGEIIRQYYCLEYADDTGTGTGTGTEAGTGTGTEAGTGAGTGSEEDPGSGITVCGCIDAPAVVYVRRQSDGALLGVMVHDTPYEMWFHRGSLCLTAFGCTSDDPLEWFLVENKLSFWFPDGASSCEGRMADFSGTCLGDIYIADS